jgi:hypothetical protein
MFEKLLLAALMAASVAGFSVRFLPILRRILAAKPDADFSVHPIGKSAISCGCMLQAKVIRDGLAGLATP